MDAAVREADQAGRGLGAGHHGAARGDREALYRTAWELPQRALIDLAAARGAVHRPEPVAEPVPGRADDRQAVVDVPVRVEGRAEDDVLPALAAGDAHPAGDGRARPPRQRRSAAPAPTTSDRLLAREPREPARPASERRERPARCSIPGMDLTLRPMRYPHFYDRFRDAIKNTWTVEEVDLHSDLADLARLSPAERHLVCAAGRVLRHRRHDRRQQPGAEPVPARQLPRGPAVPVAAAVRGGRARPVLPDPARHLRPGRGRAARRRSRRWRTSPRSGARPSSASAGSTRSATLRRLETPRRPAGVPAEPDLLRGVHRGAVLLRRLRLRVLPALARPAARPGVRAPTGCSATSRCTWRSPSTWSRRCAREEPDLFDDELARQVREMLAEAVECETQFAEDLLGAGRVRAVGRRHAGVPGARRRPAAGAARAASRSTGRRTRSRSWSCRTCRSCRTSSSGGSRRTRWRSAVASRSTTTSSRRLACGWCPWCRR